MRHWRVRGMSGIKEKQGEQEKEVSEKAYGRKAMHLTGRNGVCKGGRKKG